MARGNSLGRMTRGQNGFASRAGSPRDASEDDDDDDWESSDEDPTNDTIWDPLELEDDDEPLPEYGDFWNDREDDDRF